MRMRVDQVVNAQTFLSGGRQVAIDQRDFRVDQRGGAAFGTADQVTLATPGSAEVLEDHWLPLPARCPQPTTGSRSGRPQPAARCSVTVTRLHPAAVRS